MWVSEQWGVFTEQTEKSSQAPPSHAPPQEGLVCRQHHALPASEPVPPTPAQLGARAGPVQLRARAHTHTHTHTVHTHTHPHTHTHTRLPWLERMGWGREAEVGAALGGELLGLTQGAAESRESSLT